MMALLLTIALATTAPALNGPYARELTAAIYAAPEVAGPGSVRMETIQSVRCRAFDEDPTEFHCRFRARAKEGRWKRRSAIVALDGHGWVLLSLD